MDVLKKILKNSHLMVIICVVLMFISMCLPLASAKGEYRELLDEGAFFSELTADQVKGVSLIEHITFYTSHKADFRGSYESDSAYMIMAIFTLVFFAFTVLFALIKKATPVIIFDFLTSCMVILTALVTLGTYYGDAPAYGIGFGLILYVITSIAAAVFAVRLFIDKRRAKKAAKAAQQ